MQIAIDFVQTRARRNDPVTSHLAAKRSERFAESHAGRILAALREHGPMSAERLYDFTGLTIVQADRRLPEMQRMGLVRPTGRVFGGCRIWEACE